MNVRAAAAEVIAKVLRGQSLSALLPDYSDRVDEKDRALLKADVFWHHALVSTDRYFA